MATKVGVRGVRILIDSKRALGILREYNVVNYITLHFVISTVSHRLAKLSDKARGQGPKLVVRVPV